MSDLLTPLETYRAGTPRSALLAIDREVVKALSNPAQTAKLANQLAQVLRTGISPEAKRYVCGKLGLLGSGAAALAGELNDRAVAADARTALEALGDTSGDDALRHALVDLKGENRAGAITSLGTRRDRASIKLLERELASPDSQVSKAAAAALGNIGTEAAAQALLRHYRKRNPTNHVADWDALLTCAEQLGAAPVVDEICKLLGEPTSPKHVRKAAEALSGRLAKHPGAQVRHSESQEPK